MKKQVAFIVLIGLGLIAKQGAAQLNPLGSMYYQNAYLYNPAMAGVDNNLNLNSAYRAQWANIGGGALTQTLSADHGFNNKIGVGLSLYSEKSGVFQRTKTMLTYAYRILLDDEASKLSFGLSAVIMSERIDRTKIRGDATDQSISVYNARPLYLDADFGAAFTTERLTIQGAVPNLMRLKGDILRNTVDLPLLYTSVGYKIDFENDFYLDHIEPKVTLRKVKNYSDILDIGAQLSFSNNKLVFNTLYRTTNSFTLGVGTTYQNSLSILAFYSTNTSPLSSYTNGEFEVALKYAFKLKEN